MKVQKGWSHDVTNQAVQIRCVHFVFQRGSTLGKTIGRRLGGKDFEVFFDRTSLDVGDPWDEQLDDSLDVAQHLIVLWSKKSSASKYVDYERTYFHLKTRESRTDSAALARKEI